MKYRNKENGTIIEVPSFISSDNYEEIKEEKKETKKETKGTKAKK